MKVREDEAYANAIEALGERMRDARAAGKMPEQSTIIASLRSQ